MFVFRAGCFYRSTLESWFHQAGLVPGRIMEMGTLDGILSCVAAGMAVGDVIVAINGQTVRATIFPLLL